MNLLNKLSTTIKFTQKKKYILKRLQKLEANLSEFSSILDSVTNQPDDMVNWIILSQCATLKTQCKISLGIIEGKLKSLETITAKQTQQKLELNSRYNIAEIEYNKIGNQYEEHKLVQAAKNNITLD